MKHSRQVWKSVLLLTTKMTETDLLTLREQLQEDLMSWRDVNDLPEFVDEELCDIVVYAFSKFLNK